MSAISSVEVGQWLDKLYIACEGAGLRQEDYRKADEVAAMLDEIARAVGRCPRHAPLVLVDAASGKSYVGVLAARLVLEPSGRESSVITLEREGGRVAQSRVAAERLASTVPIDCRSADVGDASAWPVAPSIVVGLHACGPAADAIIGQTIAARARTLLLVPCCTSRAMEMASLVESKAEDLGVPRHAPVRRRFIQAIVDAGRTWRLEAAGYETEVVEFVAATVTPHNLLWRSRLVGEPVRMAHAARALEQLRRTLGGTVASSPAP